MQPNSTNSGQSDSENAEVHDLPAPPSFADVLSAQTVLRRYLAPTPLHNYPVLDAATGAEVWVKHENYLPIGAFKLRGGINFMAQLPAEQRLQGGCDSVDRQSRAVGCLRGAYVRRKGGDCRARKRQSS